MLKQNWKIGMGMVIGAGLALGIAQAQQTARPSVLTPQDYIDIQQLIARYSDAVDSCSNHGYDYADLYTDDGTYIDLWSNNGVKEGGIKWQGRDKLAEAAGGGPLTCRKSGVPNHFLVNHIIKPSADGATGKVYLLWGRGGDKPEVVQDLIYKGDWYEDTYVKTSKGWRFKQRAHVRDKARTAVFLEGAYPVGDSRSRSQR
jgi:SnoaL-like protein